MDELFQSLSKEHDIIIVTSNYEAFVKQFLEKHDILRRFESNSRLQVTTHEVAR